MRLRAVSLSFAAVLAVVVATQGCSSAPPEKAERLCTPGAYVFCRCADKSEGTKLCRPDGRSFEPCTTDDSGECKGGEIDDPRTNEPVPPPDDDDDDGGTEPPPPRTGTLDACPGKPQAVTPGVDITLEGDTTAATTDRKGRTGACAVGQGANDHVYHLIPSGKGSLEVKVQGAGGLDPVVYVRTSCEDEASQSACAPPVPSKLVSLRANVKTGGDYFLVIDGASGTKGTYTATLKLTTGSFCGDGVVDQGEACDDGNNVAGDGCASDCRKIDGNPPSGGACPGHPVHVWSGQTVTGVGSTTAAGYGNAWNAPSSSSCGFGTDGTNGYEDHVYEVTPHASGTLVVGVTPPPTGTLPNLMIAARRTCTAVGPEVGLCANDASIGGSEQLSFSVTKDQKVYVAVDGGGVTSNKGDYTISFKLQ